MMLLLGLLLASTPQPIDPPITYVKRAVAVEQLKACGFDHVALRDDTDMQEEVLAVSGITEVSEKQLRCAVEVSLSSITYVEFPEPLSQRYWQLYFQME